MTDTPTKPEAPAAENAKAATGLPTYMGMVGLAAIVLMVSWFVVSYVNGVGYTKLPAIENTRPLLVIAAIISTITFGGALLFSALFSSEGTFEDRFRHAREIFLVFSGVFGTVIGFYFGAGETHGPQLSLDASLDDTRLAVHAASGTPPYKVNVAYGRKSDLQKQDLKSAESPDGWARFTFDKLNECIQPLKVTVTDEKGLQAEKAIAVDAASLEAWPACAKRPSPPAGAAAAKP